MLKIKNKIKYLLGLLALFFPALVFAATEHPLADILTNVLRWLLEVFGIVGLIGFVISGIMYATAAGNEEQIETAKKSFTYSVIGMLIGLMGIILIKLINAKLSGQ